MITPLKNVEDIERWLKQCSSQEKEIQNHVLSQIEIINNVGVLFITQSESRYLQEKYGNDAFFSAMRNVANSLAENSGYVSLSSYYEMIQGVSVIQFRARRCARYKKIDLRLLLDEFAIKDGGGHEGAIGFRFKEQDIDDIHSLHRQLVMGLNTMVVDSL